MCFFPTICQKKKKVLAWLKCCKLRANKIGFDLEDLVCLFVFCLPHLLSGMCRKYISCPCSSKIAFSCNEIQGLSVFYFLDFVFKIDFGSE